MISKSDFKKRLGENGGREKVYINRKGGKSKMIKKLSRIVYKLKNDIADIDETRVKIGIMVGCISLIAILCTIMIVFRPVREKPIKETEQTTVTQGKDNQNKVYVDLAEVISKIDHSGLNIETPIHDVQGKLVLAELGLDTNMVRDYAISIDLKGESTHALAIVTPTEGFEQRVNQELIHYVADKQRYTYENGNTEAYEIAKKAVINNFGEYIVLIMDDSGSSQEVIEYVKDRLVDSNSLPEPQLVERQEEEYTDDNVLILE